MKFKIFYNEKTKKLDINCLLGGSQETLLPKNANHHVHYNIDPRFLSHFKPYMMEILTDEDSQDLEKVTNEIVELQTKRQKMIENIRKTKNPEIIEKCRGFKMKFPELFI